MKPRRLPSGAWNVRVMVNGQAYSFTDSDRKSVMRQASAFAAECRENVQNPPLYKCLEDFITERSESLSPSTVRGYASIARTIKARNPAIAQKRVITVTNRDVQELIKKLKTPKTQRNYVNLLRMATGRKFSVKFRNKQSKETRKESSAVKDDIKDEQKLNINNIIQPEAKKEKSSNKEGEMSYDEYINSLEEDEKNKVKEIFELFDKNLDGGVDMKELKFILNSLDIYPNHDELSAMMAEADVANKGYINESDFKYIIAKQKKEYRDKLMKEAKDAFIALGGDPDLNTKISTAKIQEILRKEFELSEELEITLKKIAQNKDEISFEDFMKFFQ